jgi:hypothetical protein
MDYFLERLQKFLQGEIHFTDFSKELDITYIVEESFVYNDERLDEHYFYFYTFMINLGTWIIKN